MIKLVVSDIDGTLLPEGTDQINPQMYQVIRSLKEKGITFVAASGRQYASMRHVFEPVADDILFIAENGSVIMQQEKILYSNFIRPELARRLVRHLRTYEDGEIMLSVPEQIYLEQDGRVRELMEKGYRARFELVPDLLLCCDHTNKITIYREHDINELGDELQERFGEELNVAVAGAIWVDFMSKTSDKGNALRWVQERLGVSPEETMAFGDNCNDIGMLQQANWSYAVSDAHPRLKSAAKYETGPCREDGVLRTILDKLL